MANKRQLKKNIKAVCGDLAAEILISSSVCQGFDPKAVNEIVAEIAQLQVNSLAPASFGFDHGAASYENGRQYHAARSAYFRKAYNELRANFKESVLKIVKDMNAAMPKEMREANKQN